MLLTLLFLLAAGLASAEPAMIAAASANVRSGAGTTSSVIGTLPRGARVDILETSGEWHRVRSADGKLEGWVNARLIQRTPAAAAPAPGPAPQAAPAPGPGPKAAPSGRGPMTIEHRQVTCLIAEQFTKIEACVTPADSVARTQVHFRASDTSPWYSVDMLAEGSCLQAVLPKPKKATKQVQYFIYALDRRFAAASRPEGAPGASFTPRVVAAKGQCGSDGIVGAVASGAHQVAVSIARSPTGKLLQGAASALGSPVEVAGFSPEGIVPGQAVTGVSSGSGAAAGAGAAAAAGAAAGAGAAGAGGGVPIMLVAGGGALAVGAAAVVVATRGGADAPASLAGTWNGSVAAGKGMTMNVTVPGATCVIRDDFDAILTQNGNVLTGSGTTTTRQFTCSFPEIQPFVASLVGQTGSGQLVATVSPPSSVSIDFGQGFILSGTYTATTIDATGRYPDTSDGTLDFILSIVKR